MRKPAVIQPQKTDERRYKRETIFSRVGDAVNANPQILIIGERNYPFPIPLVRQDGGWIFDTAAGMDELLNRRIGRNELHIIKVMRAYTEAQRESAAMTREDGVAVFARYLASHEGEKDGLYWP